jgi:two-component system response regulator FixJ
MVFKPAVHVIDDDRSFADSLRLAAQRYEIRSHQSPSKFLSSIASEPAECVVLNCDIAGLADLEFLGRMRALRGNLPIIALTGRADFALAVAIMKRGASDLLLRPVTEELLVDAIDEALQRPKTLMPGDPQAQDAARKLQTLTGREKEVLAGLLMGRQNKAIAKELGISARTVDAYRANIRAKTGAKSICEFCKWRSSLIFPLAQSDGPQGAIAAGPPQLL